MIILRCYCDPPAAGDCAKCNALNLQIIAAAAGVDQNEIDLEFLALLDPEPAPEVGADLAAAADPATLAPHDDDWPAAEAIPEPAAAPAPAAGGGGGGARASRPRNGGAKGGRAGKSGADGVGPAQSGDRG